jgi:peptide chain release factor subunit 3
MSRGDIQVVSNYCLLVQSAAADSWEEAADGDELGEDELEEEDGEETVVKPKKRVAKTEETKSKKEHINVVFIGHVGE